MINNEKKIAFQIPEEGSLGLLAMGAKGVLLWRQKRAESAMAKQNTTNEKK